MRSTFNIIFFIRRDRINTSGKAPIHLRLTVDGQSCQFSTKTEVSHKIWDAKNYRATGYSKEAAQVNSHLDFIKSGLITKFKDLIKFSDLVTPEMVRDEFLGVNLKNNTLLTTFAEFNERHEKLIGIEISQSWFNKYDLTYRRLEEFLKTKRRKNDIFLHLIDNNFVTDFHNFLKVDKGLSINSSEKLMRIFKRITTRAFKDGLIPRDPFSSYKIKKVKTDSGYLTMEEFQRFYDFQTDNARLQKVRDIFIFACLTGLDYSTTRALRSEHIIARDSGRFIVIPREKTNVISEIKLLSQAEKIIAKYHGTQAGGFVLPVMSNAKYNQYLKEIALIIGIDKRVSTHLARHTFATTITYANGVSIDAIQKMLGHTKIATTQIYARMMDKTVESEMDKLASVFNPDIGK